MERGKEKEAEAIELYEFTNDCAVERVGFITNDENTAGYSPDGLVGAEGAIEVKCNKAERHIEIVTYNKKHGKCPPSYYPQVQGGLLITGRAWVDQVFYHPDLPPLIFRVLPDLDWQAKLAAALRQVITERDAILAQMRHDQMHIPDSPLTNMDAG